MGHQAGQDRITSFAIWSRRFPLRRPIGDNSCTYDRLTLIVVRLSTHSRQDGWGYATLTTEGHFERDAWFIGQVAPIEQLRQAFEDRWWRSLRIDGPESITSPSDVASDYFYLDTAIRNALWDLWAKRHKLPLSNLLSQMHQGDLRPAAPAYASLLDFPLEGSAAVTLARQYAKAGFSRMKVKVGAPDRERDLARLRAIGAATSQPLTLSADANEGWDASTAIETLDFFQRNDIRLAYIEDPLPRDAIDDFKILQRACSVPIVAHDYYDSLSQIDALCRNVKLHQLRVSSDSIDFALACVLYAREQGLQVSMGNSFGEANTHLALAFPHVAIVEYSDLGWHRLLQHPITVRDGHLVAPNVPGTGLDPLLPALEQLPGNETASSLSADRSTPFPEQ